MFMHSSFSCDILTKLHICLWPDMEKANLIQPKLGLLLVIEMSEIAFSQSHTQ